METDKQRKRTRASPLLTNKGILLCSSWDTDIMHLTSSYCIYMSAFQRAWLQKIQLLQHNLTLIICHFFLTAAGR